MGNSGNQDGRKQIRRLTASATSLVICDGPNYGVDRALGSCRVLQLVAIDRAAIARPDEWEV